MQKLVYKFKILVITIAAVFALTNCSKSREFSSKEKSVTLFDQVRQLPDSVVVSDMVIYNLFKYQILAHKSITFDSLMIVNQVYHRHQKIWDQLYAVLFDKEMFSTEKGMIEWNKQIFIEKRDSISSRVNKLIQSDYIAQLNAALVGIERLTDRSPKNVRLSIILSPLEGIGFGGIESDAFIMDLLDNNFDVINMVEEGIPHELNHFIYDPTRENDPHKETPLRLLVDEGFACFYAYIYFDGSISKYQTVEQMNELEWQWYLDHEKEIYQRCAPYFYYQGNEDPLRQLGSEMDAPKTLFYWLGFRIVEFYTATHGQESWKEIYNLPVKEVLEKSGYQEYIENLDE